jgi:hypothetical protein
MAMKAGTFIVLCCALFGAGLLPAAENSSEEAYSRLAHSHDPAIPVAIGCLVVKQASLNAIRALLARDGARLDAGPGWNSDAPEWQAAERELLQPVEGLLERKIKDPAWFFAAWQREAGSVLDGEEADWIATHFASESGRAQRIIVELLPVGETLLANYTFTDRIDYRVKGLENEVAQLQAVVWKLEPFRVRTFPGDPQAIKFAGQDPGVKYVKMLTIRGIEVLTRHIDAVANEAVGTVNASQGKGDRFVEAYLARTGRK